MRGRPVESSRPDQKVALFPFPPVNRRMRRVAPETTGPRKVGISP